MNPRREIYEQVKELAREKRLLYPVDGKSINLTYFRGIYHKENISIHYAPSNSLRYLKAAYFYDEKGTHVFLNPNLPNEAKLFGLAHELKHHYLDADPTKIWSCVEAYGSEPLVEKSAEVFAAEFIWPESEFYSDLERYELKKDSCTPELVVHFKKTMDVPVSYAFIKKRLEWFSIIEKGEYDKVRFQNLEYEIFGRPYHLRFR